MAILNKISRINQSRLVWKWVLNFDRVLRHRLEEGSDQYLNAYVETLRREGIALLRPEEIFDQDGLLLLDEIAALVGDKLQEREVQEMLRGGHSGSGRKEFFYPLFAGDYEAGSPFIQLALQPRLLEVVNRYMGMRSYLRSVEAWLNFPTPGVAKETQLWHRDGDDFMNVKVFVYLTDVDENNGPFCFIPRTHLTGDLNAAQDLVGKDGEVIVKAGCHIGKVPAGTGGRVTDEDMAKAIPKEHWKVCTAPAKTVVVADTTAYHRGLKPVTGHRLLLQLQYTSGRPWWPRGFTLRGSLGPTFEDKQKYALFAKGVKE
ncbi:MAG: phytanoyl-CoA dioxygenase family protein [Candidatus Brocadiales bacterium]|nr:phytanoyl-CoA dioxygenase family protein [Candidatus Bathyanammoxibius sp.]